MLAYLDKVQVQEKEYLVKAGLKDWLNNTPDWDVLVTEWRIALVSIMVCHCTQNTECLLTVTSILLGLAIIVSVLTFVLIICK